VLHCQCEDTRRISQDRGKGVSVLKTSHHETITEMGGREHGGFRSSDFDKKGAVFIVIGQLALQPVEAINRLLFGSAALEWRDTRNVH
jgi:hypothetical protein